MQHIRTVALMLALVSSPLAGHASEATDALSRCLSDSTTGKDRKDLAKWIFVSMAAHPEIGPLAPTSAATTESTQRTMGALFTRLVADTCANEMRGAVKAQGPEGVKSAFEYLGKMAMQELMSNPQVTASFGGFERYVDKARLDRVLKPD